MQPTRTRTTQSGSGDLLLLLRLFLGALIALWVIDVLVNLELVRGFFLDHDALGSPQSFAGLLLGELQIAVAAAVAAWLVGLAVERFVAASRRDREAVAFLSATTVALAVLVKTAAWHSVLHSVGSKLLVSAVAGLVAWPVLRFLTRARRIDAWGIPEIIQWTLLPALAITFANDSLKRALAGSPPLVLVWVLGVCAGLCAALLFVRTRPRTRGSWVVWLPVLAAILLAGHACVNSWTCGRFDYEGVPPRRSEGRPPIFLIVLDTVRADHLRCYGARTVGERRADRHAGRLARRLDRSRARLHLHGKNRVGPRSPLQSGTNDGPRRSHGDPTLR